MARQFSINTIHDRRGSLTVIQDEVPFQIQRVFFIQGVSEPRGGHRHVLNRMVLIALQGTITVDCQTPDTDMSFELNQPQSALLLDPEDWHTMKFTSDGILLVLCSHPYSAEDYITEKYR